MNEVLQTSYSASIRISRVPIRLLGWVGGYPPIQRITADLSIGLNWIEGKSIEFTDSDDIRYLNMRG